MPLIDSNCLCFILRIRNILHSLNHISINAVFVRVARYLLHQIVTVRPIHQGFFSATAPKGELTQQHEICKRKANAPPCVLGELSRACCLADSAGLCKDLATRWHNSCTREQQEKETERERVREGWSIYYFCWAGGSKSKAKA